MAKTRTEGSPPPAWQLLLVFCGCVLGYQQSGLVHDENDAVPTMYLAWSILHHGDLRLGRYDEIQGARSALRPGTGGIVSKYPPGAGLAAAPIAAIATVGREERPSFEEMRRLGKWVGVVFSAATVTTFHWLIVQMAPGAAWPATLLLAFGTNLLSIASQAGWAHGPAVFFLLLGICLARRGLGERGPPWRLVASGAALGMAVLTRPLTACSLVALGLIGLRHRDGRWILWTAAGAAPPIAVFLAHNVWSFGVDRGIAGGYGDEIWQWSTPLLHGIAGLLISPSRGLLVFSPALVLGLAGFRRAGETLRASAPPHDRAAAVLLLGGALQLLLVARWYGWAGGWGYGPRLLIETLPAWAMLFAFGWEAWVRTAPRRLLGGSLIALAVFVHAVGVTPRYGYLEWHRRWSAPDGVTVWDVRDNLIRAQVEGWIRGGATPSAD